MFRMPVVYRSPVEHEVKVNTLDTCRSCGTEGRMVTRMVYPFPVVHNRGTRWEHASLYWESKCVYCYL